MQWVQLHILPILLTMLRYRVFWPSITTKSFYRFDLCLWYQLSTWWKQRLSTKCVFELKRKPDLKSTSSLTINRKLEPAIVDEIRHLSSRMAFPNFLKLKSKAMYLPSMWCTVQNANGWHSCTMQIEDNFVTMSVRVYVGFGVLCASYTYEECFSSYVYVPIGSKKYACKYIMTFPWAEVWISSRMAVSSFQFIVKLEVDFRSYVLLSSRPDVVDSHCFVCVLVTRPLRGLAVKALRGMPPTLFNRPV